MANRYWDGGNWNDTANWYSVASGGSSGASIPTSADNVYPRTTPTSSTFTINVSASFLNMDWTGATSPTLTGTGSMNIYGGLVYIPTMTETVNSLMQFLGSGTYTVNFAGLSLIHSQIKFYDLNLTTGTWNLASAITNTGSINVGNGTLNTSNYNINCSDFLINDGASVRGLSLGSSIITSSGNVTFASSNLTFNSSTSKFIMTGATKTFAGAGLTYYDLECQGTPITITGSNTFNDLKGTPDKTISITSGTTQTTTSMSGSGTSGHLITLKSVTAGSPFTLYKSSGTITADYYSIKDCTATGGATFEASNSTNVSGNTGWNFLGNIYTKTISATVLATSAIYRVINKSINGLAILTANNTRFINKSMSVIATVSGGLSRSISKTLNSFITLGSIVSKVLKLFKIISSDETFGLDFKRSLNISGKKISHSIEKSGLEIHRETEK